MKIYLVLCVIFASASYNDAQNIYNDTRTAKDNEIEYRIIPLPVSDKTEEKNARNDISNEIEYLKDVKEPANENKSLKPENKTVYINNNVTTFINETENQRRIIVNLAIAIESHIKSYLKDSHTLEERRIIMYKVEKRIEELIQNHRAMQSNIDEANDFTDLIMDGLELTKRRLIISNSRSKSIIMLGNDTRDPENSSLAGNSTLTPNKSIDISMPSENVTIFQEDSNQDKHNTSEGIALCKSNQHSTIIANNKIGSNSPPVGLTTLSCNQTVAENTTAFITHNSSASNSSFDVIITLLRNSIINRVPQNEGTNSNKISIKANTDSAFTSDATKINNIKYILYDQDEVLNYFNDIISETSLDPVCDETTVDICHRIQSLQNLDCGDGTIISLEELCNGEPDCGNRSDEKNCTNEVADKINRTMNIMSDVGKLIARKCLPPNASLSFDYDALQTVLHSLWQRYSKVLSQKRPHHSRRLLPDKLTNKDTKTSTILSWMLYVWQGEICTHHIDIDKNQYLEHKINIDSEIVSLDSSKNIVKHSDWSPKMCSCENNRETDTHDSRCLRICWQKFSLSHWECETYTEDIGVPLDSLCDGKFDCIDETDETGCTIDSFEDYYETAYLYKEILGLLEPISKSPDYGKSQKKILILINLVRKLLDYLLSTEQNVDIEDNITVTNKYFKILVNVYEDVLQSSNTEKLDEAYDLLIELNTKMVKAMKRSSFWNSKVLPVECYCWNGVSRLVQSFPNCKETCEIELKLMKFACNHNDKAVFIEEICNGNNDCPNNEDEKDCAKEICQRRHLVQLRHQIQKTRLSLIDKDVGHVLNDWKTKTIRHLMSAESKNLTNNIFQDTVAGILSDLIEAFGTTRRPNSIIDRVAQEDFIKMSNIVKKAFKSCWIQNNVL